MRSRSAGSLAVRFCSLSVGDRSSSSLRALANDRAELRRLAAQLLVGDRLQPRVLLVDLVDDRLDLLPFALVARSDDGADDSLEHAILYRYSRSAAMNSATASGTNPRIDFPARTRSRISVDEMSMRRVASDRGVPGIAARLGRVARPLEHYDGRKLGDSPGLPPLGERPNHVGPDEPEQLGADGQRRGQVRQCVNRVR